MNTEQQVRAFVRSIEQKASSRWGFQALQRLAGPGIDVEATVRTDRRSLCRVEFHKYESALLSSEEALAGTSEFVNAELAGMVQSTNGRQTWCYDPSSQVAICKLGRAIQEPIPGLSALGEVQFLESLSRDFLIRDLGSRSDAGRHTRKLGLKPKAPYRSQLIRTVSFPISRATLTIDTETMLPTRIAFVPSSDSPAGSLLGAVQEIVADYSEMRSLEPGEASLGFEPPADTLVFAEQRVSAQAAMEATGQAFTLDQIEASGFSLSNRNALLSTESEGARHFAALHFSRENDESRALPQQLLLLFGNYLSRRMSRLRTSTREQGESIDLTFGDAWCFDRSALWEQLLPGLESDQSPVQFHWEYDDVFWFACFTGVPSDEAVRLINTMRPADVDTDETEIA